MEAFRHWTDNQFVYFQCKTDSGVRFTDNRPYRKKQAVYVTDTAIQSSPFWKVVNLCYTYVPVTWLVAKKKASKEIHKAAIGLLFFAPSLFHIEICVTFAQRVQAIVNQTDFCVMDSRICWRKRLIQKAAKSQMRYRNAEFDGTSDHDDRPRKKPKAIRQTRPSLHDPDMELTYIPWARKVKSYDLVGRTILVHKSGQTFNDAVVVRYDEETDKHIIVYVESDNVDEVELCSKEWRLYPKTTPSWMEPILPGTIIEFESLNGKLCQAMVYKSEKDGIPLFVAHLSGLFTEEIRNRKWDLVKMSSALDDGTVRYQHGVEWEP